MSPRAVTLAETGSEAELTATAGALTARLQAMRFNAEEARPARQPAPDGARDQIGDELARTSEFWRHRGTPTAEDIHVRVIRHPTAEAWPRHDRDLVTPPRFPVIELEVSELRAGGFSQAGLDVYTELTDFLRARGNALTIVSTPPVDEAEHQRLERLALTSAAAWWLAAWPVFCAVIWPLIGWGLRREKFSLAVRRIVFVVVGVALVTPMPFPTMFMSVLLPNVLMLLSGAEGYAWLFQQHGMMLPAAFAASLALSVVAAFLVVRKRRAADAPAESG